MASQSTLAISPATRSSFSLIITYNIHNNNTNILCTKPTLIILFTTQDFFITEHSDAFEELIFSFFLQFSQKSLFLISNSNKTFNRRHILVFNVGGFGPQIRHVRTSQSIEHQCWTGHLKVDWLQAVLPAVGHQTIDGLETDIKRGPSMVAPH